MLTVTHQQAKWHTYKRHDSSKTDHKDQKVGGGPIPGSPRPFPRQLEYSSHSLAYKITHHYKNWQPHTLGPLSPSEMAHTLWNVFLSK